MWVVATKVGYGLQPRTRLYYTLITQFTKKKLVCVASTDVVPKCRYNGEKYQNCGLELIAT